jgi:adenine-specific DNA-methyltransferase
VSHPKPGSKKPNWIEVNNDTSKWLMPSGYYVVMRRLSSKEERRRLVPAVLDPTRVTADLLGFDNKTNILHCDRHGMSDSLAKGLAVYLGSTFADRWLRRFSGHTQVNAGDLRTLRYPGMDTLKEWGRRVDSTMPGQEEIDCIVGGCNV